MSDSQKVRINKYGAGSIIREFVIVLIIGLLIWLSAGLQLWLNAWIYIIFLLLFSIVFMSTMVQKNPGLLNIRGAPQRAMREIPLRGYEKLFFAFFTPLMFLIPIVAGLDYGGFFGLWILLPFAVPLWLVFMGLMLVFIGEAIFGWAMVVNPFFHGMMTIQNDRGHQVVSKGPYRWIRHPGYLGQLFYYLGTPLLLASWSAFFLGILMALLFVYRTVKEDQVLQNELSGYDGYSEQVRKRLVPGIW